MEHQAVGRSTRAASLFRRSNCFFSRGQRTQARGVFLLDTSLSSSLISNDSTRHSVTSRIQRNSRFFSDLSFSTRHLNATLEKRHNVEKFNTCPSLLIRHDLLKPPGMTRTERLIRLFSSQCEKRGWLFAFFGGENFGVNRMALCAGGSDLEFQSDWDLDRRQTRRIVTRFGAENHRDRRIARWRGGIGKQLQAQSNGARINVEGLVGGKRKSLVVAEWIDSIDHFKTTRNLGRQSRRNEISVGRLVRVR